MSHLQTPSGAIKEEKLQIYGIAKLALMPFLQMLCICENLECNQIARTSIDRGELLLVKCAQKQFKVTIIM